MTAPLRVALYARVSTSDQSLDPQLDALRKYAAARGWEPREYLDHGQSGRSDQRAGLRALLDAARRREVDAVAVAKLDRLGRSLAHLLTVLGELEALSVAFVSLDDDAGPIVGCQTNQSEPVSSLSSCVRQSFHTPGSVGSSLI